MDREKWAAVRGVLFAALALIAALAGGTMYVVFRQAGLSYQAAVDRCHDAGGAWVAAGRRSYSGQCLRTSRTAPRPPAER
jgi:hypothetical protein